MLKNIFYSQLLTFYVHWNEMYSYVNRKFVKLILGRTYIYDFSDFLLIHEKILRFLRVKSWGSQRFVGFIEFLIFRLLLA